MNGCTTPQKSKMTTSAHPLDPLTPEEITHAATACKNAAEGKGIATLRFNTITLKEPAKKVVLAYDAAPSAATLPPRQAFCILLSVGFPGAIEVVVTLGSDNGTVAMVDSWVVKEGVNALATPDDCFDAEAIVKADPEVMALLADKYGITDLDMVVCDPWSVHLPPCSGRLIQTFMYLRVGHAMDNAYAHPIDFVPIVDLDHQKVVRIDKPFGDSPPPVPTQRNNYHQDLCDQPLRTDIKPLNVVQPEGPSWTVDGNLVEWQKWRVRLSFNYREGLVLNTVSYNDGGVQRPVLHRASLVEMAVPYGAPQEPFTRKCAFDVGDYGLGNCATSLALGCDCLGNIHYFDAVLNNSKGEPVVLPKMICMHEEDAGLLWKHVEYRNGHNESRRSRRLVLSFVSTVVNYEYAFYWYFYQDGSIGYDIKLTGELSTNPLAPDELAAGKSIYSTMVADGVSAQFHQHMFNMRVDFSVDDPEGGKGLVVSEVEVEAVPEGPENPAGNAFLVKNTPLLTESEAQRVADPMKSRYWKVSNPASLHPITKGPVAFKVVLPPGPLMLAGPNSMLTKRGKFATKSLWVTPHSDEERWPAGDYTIQSEGGEGLEKWTAADRSLVDADPVLWLTFGVTHVVRVEDFPVMPCEVVSLHFKPFNFFGSNPGLDIPAAPNAASTLAGTTTCCKN